MTWKNYGVKLNENQPERCSLEFLICDDNGLPLDAVIEIEPNSIVLQSRGGTKGSPRASNTDYSHGLRLLLARFQKKGDNFLDAFVDSSRVQELPLEERRVLSIEDLDTTVKRLFTLISKRMQAVGKHPTTTQHVGNANKRLRFNFSGLSTKQLEEVSQGISSDPQLRESPKLSSSELCWAEGELHLISHLERERARGVGPAKKAAFIRDHGKLLCERCNLDPVSAYGDLAAEACIEVHHRATQVSEMVSGHLTTLDDLQCLCANCHRFVHALLKNEREPKPISTNLNA